MTQHVTAPLLGFATAPVLLQPHPSGAPPLGSPRPVRVFPLMTGSSMWRALAQPRPSGRCVFFPGGAMSSTFLPSQKHNQPSKGPAGSRWTEPPKGRLQEHHSLPIAYEPLFEANNSPAIKEKMSQGDLCPREAHSPEGRLSPRLVFW